MSRRKKNTDIERDVLREEVKHVAPVPNDADEVERRKTLM